MSSNINITRHSIPCQSKKLNDIICLGDFMFKEYRKKHGYTQETLSEILNISSRHLQRIERNKNEPSLELFRKMVKVLNIDDKDIVNFIKEKESKQ